MRKFGPLLVILVGGVLLVPFATAATQTSLTPLRQRCEYLKDPLGLDMKAPRFSWALKAPYNGAEQSAYRILVADTRSDLSADSADMWDTGKVSSSDQVNIAYDGKNLESGEKYFWKVRVWNEDGQPGPDRADDEQRHRDEQHGIGDVGAAAPPPVADQQINRVQRLDKRPCCPERIDYAAFIVIAFRRSAGVLAHATPFAHISLLIASPAHPDP